MTKGVYVPSTIFSDERSIPRVMIAPQRYIQGEGVIDNIGRYITLLNAKHAAVLASSRGHGAEGAMIIARLNH